MVATECALRRPPIGFPARPSHIKVIVLLTALYSALIYLQIQRHLWFDELLTYHIAQAPDFSRLAYLVRRWDLSPPLSHWLAHISLLLVHGNTYAVRIPSVIEFYLASLLLYSYSARKLKDWFAILPVLLLWYSPILQFATEARPYALLVMFFCCLLLLRDLAVTSARRNWVLAGIAASSIGLLSSHVLAPLSLFPFAIAELARFVRRRQSDYLLWTTLFLPLILMIVYLPLIESFRTITYYPLAFQAGLNKLDSFYWHTFLDVAWCAILPVVAGLTAMRGKLIWSPPALRYSDWALFGTAAIVPVLLDLILMREQAPFWGRYCITSVIVLYFLLAILIQSLLGAFPRAGFILASTALILLIGQKLLFRAYTDFVHPPPVNLAWLAKIRPDLPVVAASGLTFVEIGQYEDRALRARLFYLRDRSAAIQFAHATLFEDMSEFQKEFNLPGTVDSYAHFIHTHHDFLVFGTFNYPEDWLLRKLAADSAVIHPLARHITPYKDKSVFEVHIRHASEQEPTSAF